MPAGVRISSRAWKTLKEIAEYTGETMYAVLDRAVEAYRRQWLLQKTNEACAALKGNPNDFMKGEKGTGKLIQFVGNHPVTTTVFSQVKSFISHLEQ